MVKCCPHGIPLINCLQAKLDPGLIIVHRVDVTCPWNLCRVPLVSAIETPEDGRELLTSMCSGKRSSITLSLKKKPCGMRVFPCSVMIISELAGDPAMFTVVVVST